MSEQLRIVAVGFLSPLRDEIICGGDFGDTWSVGVQNSIDSATYAPKLLTEEEMQAELEALQDGIADEEYHAGGGW